MASASLIFSPCPCPPDTITFVSGFSSKYSFARAEVIKKQRQYLLYTNAETLSRYLSSNFIADLNKYSADEIVRMYGTHVLTKITVGGSYRAYYKSVIVEEANRTEKMKTVTAGAKYNMKKVGLDANGSWNTTTITETNKKNSNWTCDIKCLGGTTSGTTITLSPNQGPTTTINLGAWTQSVDDTHSRLVDVDWNATYPIYDLVSDPAKKVALKNAVEKYIDSFKLEILELLPLYNYYSSKHINSSYFTEWKGTHFNTDDYQGVTCYLCASQVEGTVPLYEYYSAKYINQSLSQYKGNIVGFSNRLNTILVPQSFMNWANKNFAPDAEAQPARLIIEVSNPADSSIASYFQKKGYETEDGKLDAGKTTYFLRLIVGIVLGVGLFISILSFYILMLSIFLLLQKNTTKLESLLLIGYSPNRWPSASCGS